MAEPYSFAGYNRRGQDAGGQILAESAAELAAILHADGWREAVVRHVGGTEVVGGVSRHPDTNRREWWGENAPTRSDASS
jgi:hypothetical protein